MANTSVRRSNNRDRVPRQAQLKQLPLVTRRFAAWAVEVSLIVTSGVVPFSLGVYANNIQPVEQQVPLNSALVNSSEAIASSLALPISNSNRQVVAPLTNWLWSAALVAPLMISGWQLYLLAKTGKTLPKRWFGVRVVTTAGTPPGIYRVFLREGVGSWGIPLSIAYLLWRYSAGFPNLAILATLSGLTVLGEGMSARFHRQRRCLHDLLAGTYVVDGNRNVVPFIGIINSEQNQNMKRETSIYRWKKPEEEAAGAPSAGYTNSTIVLQPKNNQQFNLWRWMRQHPTFTLTIVSSFSIAAVLGTLVGTQAYIQTQAHERQKEQYQSQQFLTLLKQLNASSPASLEQRQKAILALGTLKDPQGLQLLVNLLSQTTTAELSTQIEQALITAGPASLPYLQRLNQSLSQELESVLSTDKSQNVEMRIQQLQKNQRAIAKILSIYSGKLQNVDLSRINLSQTASESQPFSLVLDHIDLSGIGLQAANLNQASLQGSRLRGVGKDGRADTFDDAIADISDAQLKQANLTGANLSRIVMNRTTLIRAILNGANLSGASLSGANLSSAQMVEADLHDAILENASLTGANLGEANLTQANLSAARLGKVNALGSKLQLANLSASDWQGADLSRSDLSRANLRNADLSATKLNQANLRNAQMQNVKLHNADLSLADLRGANLAGADFQGVIFNNLKPNQADQFIQQPADETLSAVVEGVDFSQAKNLDVQQIAYICIQGGHHPRCP